MSGAGGTFPPPPPAARGAAARGVLLIGFEAAEAGRLATTLAVAGYRGHPVAGAREAAAMVEGGTIGLALADLEGGFADVLGAIEALRVAGRPRCPLLGVGSVEAGAAMTDALRALGLEGLVPSGVTPQELVFRVNAILHVDRRAAGGPASRRVPVDLPARFEGVDGPAEGRILNLSATGLFLAAKDVLPTNRSVTVTFTLAPGTEPIKAACRVVWSNPGRSESRYFQGMGLQFLQMKPAAREALQAFLADALADLGPLSSSRGAGA